MRFWKLVGFLTIIAGWFSFAGCKVSALEKPQSNSNTAGSKTQSFGFAAVGATPDPAKSNSNAENANQNLEEMIAKTAEEISQNLRDDSNSTQPEQLQKSPLNTKFDVAVAQNRILERSLVWTFGGRSQIGWFVYKPLICRTIKAEFGVEENEFAETLARWQKANDLAETGILDTPTMTTFVGNWQANRLKMRGYASPNELMTAPIEDFYDPSRPDELRQVERATYAAYKKLVAAALADQSLNLAGKNKDELAPPENFLKIISAFRSRDYQQKLRRESPNSGSAGLAAGNSPHFTGRALDVYVGGEPVSTKTENRAVQINTKVYLWLVKNAGRFGFKPYFYEPWHWEYAPE